MTYTYAEAYTDDFEDKGACWQPQEFAEMEFTPADARLATLLENGKIIDEQAKLSAVQRLAQVAIGSGSISAKAVLAHYGGVELSRADIYRKVVNAKPDDKIDYDSKRYVLRKAREMRDAGDNSRFTALSALIGYYPPETGDHILIPQDTVDPINRHSFPPSDEMVDFNIANELMRDYCVPPES